MIAHFILLIVIVDLRLLEISGFVKVKIQREGNWQNGEMSFTFKT